MESGCVLISDLDGTLLGDDAALVEWAEWLQKHRSQIRLVYSSGRFASSIRRSIETTRLPQPDAIIGGVGTEIHFEPCGEPLSSWQESLRGFDALAVRQVLDSDARLELQPVELQSEWKISYFAHDLSSSELGAIGKSLKEAGCQARMVYSSCRDLDLLPAAADKGLAARFLAEHWKFPREHVMVSGDSGNDLAMFAHGFRGIVVGNAAPELKLLCDPYIYQSDRSHAAGVLQGLRHWWVASGGFCERA